MPKPPMKPQKPKSPEEMATDRCRESCGKMYGPKEKNE